VTTEAGPESSAPAVPPEPVPLSRNVDYQLLWWGRAVGGVGNSLAFFAFPLLAQEHLGGSHAAGLTLVADQLGLLTSILGAGLLADRVDRRLLLLAATGLQLVAVTAVLGLLAAHALTLPRMLISVFVAGVAWSIYGTAETAAVAQVVPGVQRAEAAARNQVRSYLVALLVAPVGGLVFTLNDRLPFAIDVALVIVLAGALLGIRRRLLPDPQGGGGRGGLLAQAREGFEFLLRDRVQRRVLVILVVVNAVDPVLVLAVLAIANNADHGGTGTGFIYGAGTALGLAGSLLTPRLLRRARPGLFAVGALWLLAAAMAAMAAATGLLPLAGACYALTYLSVPVLMAVLIGYRVARTPPQLQGRSQAASALMVLALRPVVAAVAGFTLGGHLSSSIGVSAGVVGLLALWSTLSPVLRTMPPAAQWSTGA
jgi:predicted MFS family arabinose efflux permease